MKNDKSTEFSNTKRTTSDVDFNEVTVDLSESCSIDNAVAKMLGWLKGPTSLVNILIDKDGISEEKLIALDVLVYPLNEHLEELHRVAEDAAVAALEDPNSSDEYKTSTMELLCIREEQINKARLYKFAIDDELSKDTLSELKTDSTKTKEFGETYIKIFSLDRWARKYHNVQILEGAEVSIPADKATHKAQRQDVLAEQLEPILNKMLKPTATKVMTELRKLIGKDYSCVIANTGDGIKWENNAGDLKILTIKALENRISRWKKGTKNPAKPPLSTLSAR